MNKLFDKLPELSNDTITIKPMTIADEASLDAMIHDESVYRYLPTFLFEKQYSNAKEVLENVYETPFKEKKNIILGIYLNSDMAFVGLAEFYGFSDSIHKISIGYRLIPKYWNQGIATQVATMMVNYLYDETDIEIITASTMSNNTISEKVLENSGFIKTTSNVNEDWGYDSPSPTNKWFA